MNLQRNLSIENYCYSMDIRWMQKYIKCLLEWWRKHETMFSTIGFLVKYILGIVNFQIEIFKFFSLVKILINLRRCHLQFLKNLEKLIFVNKNWSNDMMVDCKASNNLVQLIDFELYLKHDIRWNLETHLSKMNWKLICCSLPSICLKSYHTFLFRY